MFEKEAEEYYNGQYDAWLEGEESYALEEEVEQAFKDGAEFGYNQAKGELEEKYKETICNLEMNLNEIANEALRTAEQRERNGAAIKTDTSSMIKHCATEVVEAMEAYQKYGYATYFEEGSSIQELNRKIEEHKNNFASELADIIMCCFIIASLESIDIEEAIAKCQEKNRLRAEGKGDKK